MRPTTPSAQDERVAAALSALGNPIRLAILRQLRQPVGLRELRVRGRRNPSEGRDAGPITVQSVKKHLARLLAAQAIIKIEAPEGRSVRYLVDHQGLFILAEHLRELAQLRPMAELESETRAQASTGGTHEIVGPCLVLVKGLEEGRIHRLDGPRPGQQEWIIGRRRGVDVCLDYDPFVSALNSRIRQVHGRHVLEDLQGSRNGTWLNFRPVVGQEAAALKTGDLVSVGRSMLMFHE